jgi:hypothetical protein
VVIVVGAVVLACLWAWIILRVLAETEDKAEKRLIITNISCWPANNRLQRTALLAAAEPERWPRQAKTNYIERKSDEVLPQLRCGP